jgi:hypothetical protein
MTEAISDVDYVESQFSRRPGHSPATTTPPDSGPSEDVTTPAEPGTDTTATPPNTASGTNTDRLIGWFARRRSAKTGRARRWIGLLLLSATLIAAGCEGWLLLQKHRTAVAATQALDAAQAFMRGLTTIDENRIDATHAVLGRMVARESRARRKSTRERCAGTWEGPRQHRPRRFRPRTRSQRCMFHIAGPGAHR